MKKFSPNVIKELRYYVYRLIDPRNGDTFYVGKGHGNRVFEHVNNVSGLLNNEDEDELSIKYERIIEIKKAGLDVIHIIHRHNMNEDVALEVEAALIDAFAGLTNLASGKGNDFGPMNAIEIERRYLKEEANFGEDKILMISINKTAGDREVYEAVRFAWRIDTNKANKAKYILAVEKGLIIGVFIAHEWKKARRDHFPGHSSYTNKRYGFSGEEAPKEVLERYLYKRIPDVYRKKGASNPIRYNF